MTKIIAEPNSLELAASVSKLTGFKLIKKFVRIFPDKEVYIRLKSFNFDQEKVFIIHSLFPKQNDNLIRLFLTLDLVKDYNGKPYLILPYLAYARQDKRFQAGEAYSLKTLAKLFKSLGVEFLLTIDNHYHRKVGKFDFFGIPAKNISVASLLVDYAKKFLDDLVVVGPDSGARDFLAEVKEPKIFLEKEKYCPVCKKPATLCECKTKLKRYEIRMKVPKNVENKNVLILDDMIATGSTIIQAIEVLKPKVKKIAVACTHGLFLGDSLNKLQKLADYVFTSDTIPSKVSKVSIAKSIVKEIKSI